MHPYPRPFSALTNYDVGNTNSKINYELVKVGYIKNPSRNTNNNTSTRPATHHQMHRPGSRMDYKNNNHNVPRRPSTNQGSRRATKNNNNNNLYNKQRQRILILNRNNNNKNNKLRARPATTTSHTSRMRKAATANNNNNASTSPFSQQQQQRRRQQALKKRNQKQEQIRGGERPVSRLMQQPQNVKKVGLYAALQGSPKQISPRPARRNHNNRATTSMGFRNDNKTNNNNNLDNNEKSKNVVKNNGVYGIGLRPATAIGTNFYKNYNNNINKYNLHTDINEMMKIERKETINERRTKRPTTGIIKNSNVGYQQHRYQQRPSTTGNNNNPRVVTSRVSFNTTNKSSIENNNDDLDTYIPPADMLNNHNNNDTALNEESNVNMMMNDNNNMLYDSDIRLHPDAKELHALIDRMENMVEEQRMKPIPWEAGKKRIGSNAIVRRNNSNSNNNDNMTNQVAETVVENNNENMKSNSNSNASMYSSSMKSIDIKLNIKIPDRPEDTSDHSFIEVDEEEEKRNMLRIRRGPKQIQRPQTSNSPRKFSHKFSFQKQIATGGKNNNNNRKNYYGRPRPSTSSGSRLNSNRSRNSNNNNRVNRRIANKNQGGILKRRPVNSPRKYPPRLDSSAYAAINITEKQANALLKEGTSGKQVHITNLNQFRNEKITTALELSSRQWQKHSPRAASPTHVRLKEEVKRLERAVGNSKQKILQEIDVLLHPSNRAL